MRILHLSNSFYPSVTGGTEIFVHQLIEAQRLLPLAWDVLWAAHQPVGSAAAPGDAPAPGLLQRLLPPVKCGGRLAAVGSEAAAIPGFQELLEEFRPDVVHLHSFSDCCGLSHARAAKAFGARLVVTVHAPGFTCMKGNLIDASGTICDGLMRQRRCTRCRLHNGGLPRPVAAAVALQNGWPLTPETPGAIAHVLTSRQLTAAFQAAWRQLAQLADAIHVLAQWSREVLLRNGASTSQVHLIRTAGPAALPPRQRKPMEDGMLRLVYWGRCHAVKGLDRLIASVRALSSSSPIRLDFIGPGWESPYGRRLRQRIDGDIRFSVVDRLPASELLSRLQSYDLGVIPSTWLETGPLTVLEARSADLPIAGSDHGGIRELIHLHGGGVLLPLNTLAWVAFFRQVLAQPDQLSRYQWDRTSGQRSFGDLANELLPLYANPADPWRAS